jgi:hypothetical protein
VVSGFAAIERSASGQRPPFGFQINFGVAQMCCSAFSRDFFGWRSRLRMHELAGRGHSAIGNQKNVCAKPLHRRWRLWALDDRRGDLRCAAHGWRTLDPGGWPGPWREASGKAGVNGQGMRGLLALCCARESEARVWSRWPHRGRPTWWSVVRVPVSAHGADPVALAAGCQACRQVARLRCGPMWPLPQTGQSRSDLPVSRR